VAKLVVMLRSGRASGGYSARDAERRGIFAEDFLSARELDPANASDVGNASHGTSFDMTRDDFRR
jgi:hypothetical protein